MAFGPRELSFLNLELFHGFKLDQGLTLVNFFNLGCSDWIVVNFAGFRRDFRSRKSLGFGGFEGVLILLEPGVVLFVTYCTWIKETSDMIFDNFIECETSNLLG